MGSKFGSSFLIQKALPIVMLNNSRLNIDKYLLQIHVSPVNKLCHCFKQHHRIQVNPIKQYAILMKTDSPEVVLPDIIEEEKVDNVDAIGICFCIFLYKSYCVTYIINILFYQ